jgi:hypothetical protein
MTILKLTKIPNLNLIVIKQSGGNVFVASENSIVIDDEGLYQILEALLKEDMLDAGRITSIVNSLIGT